MQSLLEHDENYALINSSLNIELIEIRNILICPFGCLYDHEKAFKIKQGLDMKKKESVANAMELIDMIVKKSLLFLLINCMNQQILNTAVIL